jgi:hypothetical protein
MRNKEIYTSKVRKPKVEQTTGGEFVDKLTNEPYVGSYIKNMKGLYFAGTSQTPDSKELVRIRTKQPNGTLATTAMIVAALLVGYFIKKVTSADKKNGVTKRYFAQDKEDGKIVETDKDTFQRAQNELTDRNLAQVDWLIKGPAEDREINGYMFEGAESKNRKTIQALEKTIPGISTFITDYKFLIEDPIQPQELYTDTVVQTDSTTQLENDRKANFDLKK